MTIWFPPTDSLFMVEPFVKQLTLASLQGTVGTSYPTQSAAHRGEEFAAALRLQFSAAI